MPQTIIFVPGFWEGSQPFENVSTLLSQKSYETTTCSLKSTGTISPGNPSMHDDIAAIKTSVEAVVGAGKDVVLVLHSGGGFLGSNAIEGLGAKARAQQGLEGGIVGIVFISGAVFPEGFEHGPLPFTEVKDGALLCLDPKNTFFNDLDAAVAEEWLAKLQPQPASNWDGTVTYCGWREIPSVYLVCEQDQAIPAAMQVQMAEAAGSRIEKCGAGHMPMLSMPGKVAAVIEAAVASF